MAGPSRLVAVSETWHTRTAHDVPGVVEWWSAEVTTFVSGYISETEQAVNGVGFQILVFLFMVKCTCMCSCGLISVSCPVIIAVDSSWYFNFLNHQSG